MDMEVKEKSGKEEPKEETLGTWEKDEKEQTEEEKHKVVQKQK